MKTIKFCFIDRQTMNSVLASEYRKEKLRFHNNMQCEAIKEWEATTKNIFWIVTSCQYKPASLWNLDRWLLCSCWCRGLFLFLYNSTWLHCAALYGERDMGGSVRFYATDLNIIIISIKDYEINIFYSCMKKRGHCLHRDNQLFLQWLTCAHTHSWTAV